MRLFNDLPDLDLAEAHRFWMTPAIATEVAGLWGDDVDHRKFFENFTARGLIPFRRSSSKATAPKLHSLLGAVKGATAWHVVQSGWGFDVADAVGSTVVKLLEETIRDCATRNDVPRRAVTFSTWRGRTTADVVELNLSVDDLFSYSDPIYSVLGASDIIDLCLNRYGQAWSNDLYSRGLVKPSKYDGCDDQGNPLDPNHPWNRDLPPLERTKRLAEIEEYIARRGQASDE